MNGIVFCNRKSEVDVVAKSLKKHGFDAAPIHGDLDQSMRTRTLENFRNGGLKLLIASDVAARGLDIPAVGHVFNYDVPHHSEDYVHRIGRTGRAGRTGEAYTIVTPNDVKNWDKVVKLIGKSPEEITVQAAVSEGRAEPQSEPRVRRSSERTREDAPAPRRARATRPREAARADPEAIAEAAPATVEPPAEQAPAPVAPERQAGGYGSRPTEGVRKPASYGRRDFKDDLGPSVVGFGADTPAFLLRAPRPAPTVEGEMGDGETAVVAKPAPARRKRAVKAVAEDVPVEA